MAPATLTSQAKHRHSSLFWELVWHWGSILWECTDLSNHYHLFYLSFKVLLAQLQPTHGVTPQAIALPVKCTPGSAVQGPACEPTSYPPGGNPTRFQGFPKTGASFQADKGRSRVQNEVSCFKISEKPPIPNIFKPIQTEYHWIHWYQPPTSHMLAFYMDIILSPVLHFFLLTKWGTLENLRSLERSNFQWLHP